MRRIRGFTLLEILIAMIMISILSSIAFPKYQIFVTQSKVTAAYASLNSIKPQVEHFLARSSNPQKLDTTHLGLDQDTLDRLGTLSLQHQQGEQQVSIQMKLKFEPVKNATLTLVRRDGIWSCHTSLNALYQPSACAPVTEGRS